MYGLEGTVSMTNSPYLLYLVARFFEPLLWFMSVGNGGQIPCPNQTMVREKDAFLWVQLPRKLTSPSASWQAKKPQTSRVRQRDRTAAERHGTLCMLA